MIARPKPPGGDRAAWQQSVNGYPQYTPPRPASILKETPMTTHTQVLRTHLDTADRNWFAAHPSAQWRKRRYVPGEDAGEYGNDPTHVVVFRRTDGSLVHRHFRAVAA